MTDLMTLVKRFQTDLRKYNVELCQLRFDANGHQHFINALEEALGVKVHRDRTITFNRTEILVPEDDESPSEYLDRVGHRTPPTNDPHCQP